VTVEEAITGLRARRTRMFGISVEDGQFDVAVEKLISELHQSAEAAEGEVARLGRLNAEWSKCNLQIVAKCSSVERQLAELREALERIAANTCCDRCQEAALVARAALTKGGERWGGSA
jgi:hypothetical protein